MPSLFTPQQLGIKPPPGGFQTGGFYEGRQFFNGTLSDPGVIHPQSSQQGAGQLVSQEVNQQSSIAQGQDPNAIQNFIQQAQQQQAQQQPQPQPQQQPQQQQPQPASPDGQIGAEGAGVPDLTALHQNLFKQAGIEDIENRITESESQFLEARNKISDNPFLSASVVDQRVKRLRQTFEKESQPLRDDLAMKKADIETQLNLQIKQFDINSDAAKQALDRFGFFLQSGALDSASGEAIAELTRNTGVSSSMIQSAIAAKKRKDQPDPKMISFDDGNTQGFVLINPETGAVISRQSVASSKPRALKADEKPPKPGSTQFKAEAQSSINQFITQSGSKTGYLNSVQWKRAMDAFLGDDLGSRDEFIKQFASYTNPSFSEGGFQKSYGFPKIKREDITGEVDIE